MAEKGSIKALIEASKLLLHGRCARVQEPEKISDLVNKDSYALFHTGSALEFNIKGGYLKVLLYTDYDQYEQWVSVLLNGAVVQRLMLKKGLNELECVRGMSPDLEKNIRIIKEGQAFESDRSSLLIAVSAETDGEFLQIYDRELKIEFIGDSITSAEGCIGAKSDMDWIPMFFSATNSYSFLLSEKLGADYRVFSQSGWGIKCGWDGNPYCSVPAFYESVCGFQKGEKQLAAGAGLEYDFSAWKPDVVVFNLGTNDFSAINQPDFVLENGEKSDLKNADGVFDADSIMKWCAHAIDVLGMIRRNNPDAHIVWALGMLGDGLFPLVYKTVAMYRLQNAGSKLHFLPLKASDDETVGSRQHPGRRNHEEAAEELYKLISTLDIGKP